MKTKYVNKSKEMRQITFTDNTSVFLRRGDVIETDKEVKRMGDGIKAQEVKSSYTAKKKASDSNSAE